MRYSSFVFGLFAIVASSGFMSEEIPASCALTRRNGSQWLWRTLTEPSGSGPRSSGVSALSAEAEPPTWQSRPSGCSNGRSRLKFGRRVVEPEGEVKGSAATLRMSSRSSRSFTAGQCRHIKVDANRYHQDVRAGHPQAHVGSRTVKDGGSDHCRSHRSACAPGNGRNSQVAWAASGRGKRGGIRTIYFHHAGPEAIYMLTAYAKADREDLTPADRKVLSRLVAAIKKEEANG